MEVITNYFPDLSPKKLQQFQQLETLYQDWNLKINVVSRKDVDELYVRHVLHSLVIAKIIDFLPGAKVMDVGTGGGFPGIPLAILFPDTRFILIDSIGKKIKVVNEVVAGLALKNVTTVNDRVENVNHKADFIVSRAVAVMPTFVHWVQGKILTKNRHTLANGIFYLKGGDLQDELSNFPRAVIHPINHFFKEDFFETKKVVYLPF